MGVEALRVCGAAQNSRAQEFLGGVCIDSWGGGPVGISVSWVGGRSVRVLCFSDPVSKLGEFGQSVWANHLSRGW